uniref:Uncharacterized protein n=1 Tax=Yersinia enterocolitica W22703 TaxID=913028 RepID=F4N091_YEREN|nr:unknown protein [Yersinia enterocolitica W22703]
MPNLNQSKILLQLDNVSRWFISGEERVRVLKILISPFTAAKWWRLSAHQVPVNQH